MFVTRDRDGTEQTANGRCPFVLVPIFLSRITIFLYYTRKLVAEYRVATVPGYPYGNLPHSHLPGHNHNHDAGTVFYKRY